MSRSLPILIVASFLSIGLMSCNDSGGNTGTASGKKLINPTKDIPFRKDGNLAFTREDGSVIKEIELEIADTDSLRERGLMQRSSIGDSQGMLFVFDRPSMQSFWMANTPLSLDFFFFNQDGSIVNIEKYVKPMSTEHTVSTGPARYVLEVESGFIDRNGITEADKITWNRLEE